MMETPAMLDENTTRIDVVLAPRAQLPALRRPSRIEIVKAVAIVTDVPVQDIVGRSRRRRLVWARHLACYIGSVLHGYSTPQMGLRLDRDHTTVMHGARRIADAILDGNQRVSGLLAEVNELLRSGLLDALPLPGPVHSEPKPPAREEGRTYPHELLRLREKGWSVKGLARRYDLPSEVVARIVGVDIVAVAPAARAAEARP